MRAAILSCIQVGSCKKIAGSGASVEYTSASPSITGAGIAFGSGMMDVRFAYVRSPFTLCVMLMNAGLPQIFERSNFLSSSGVNARPRHEVSSA